MIYFRNDVKAYCCWIVCFAFSTHSWSAQIAYVQFHCSRLKQNIICMFYVFFLLAVPSWEIHSVLLSVCCRVIFCGFGNESSHKSCYLEVVLVRFCKLNTPLVSRCKIHLSRVFKNFLLTERTLKMIPSYLPLENVQNLWSFPTGNEFCNSFLQELNNIRANMKKYLKKHLGDCEANV